MFDNLSLVSFVGVDKSTNFRDLEIFTSSNRIYEFGILHSSTKNGNEERYPEHWYSKKYLEWAKENKVASSLHLCGDSINLYFEEDKDIIDIADLAGRIQLNLNLRTMHGFEDYHYLSNKIIEIASKYNHHIILQLNNTKKKFNEIFLSKKINFNLSLLNDSSGGFGKEIEEVFPPYEKYFTGYAGGINPDNVLKIIDLIEKTNSEKRKYYIDMESGIRENNIFSIEKCKKIYSLIETKNL